MSENIIQKELIKQLADLLKENNLSEIEWSKGDLKIKVGKNITYNSSNNLYSEKLHNENSQIEVSASKDNKDNAIISPMVGTAYLAPEPGGKNFVEIGDSIKEGQQILIIEAMKTMNPIVSNKNGKIIQILVKDGSPVEFGESLVIVE
ncbi:MAG: acetyl-CoA carboxylase biotin carboxyl carrier protein subunit [Rhodospirillaceae bacterium]|nr:acetyl-CoA carboxylase biotin carboxyl carrier protein subunit [Rhodospirillaceae bacterium]|tara:strand:+ start:45348 stop:45791 length:444 start_codon:yes stop_codon:yes gene_type:complete